jgi:hypothetical protein
MPKVYPKYYYLEDQNQGFKLFNANSGVLFRVQGTPTNYLLEYATFGPRTVNFLHHESNTRLIKISEKEYNQRLKKFWEYIDKKISENHSKETVLKD